jgi:hypothetical protein
VLRGPKIKNASRLLLLGVFSSELVDDDDDRASSPRPRASRRVQSARRVERARDGLVRCVRARATARSRAFQ